jgi:protein SCO1
MAGNSRVCAAIGGWALALVLAALLTAGAISPSLARADGDPASDVLVAQSLFLPYDANASSAQQERLTDLLNAAQHAGFPIRVAVIPSEYDLGSVSMVWLNPRTYARFLGVELSLTYTQRLLIVMPNGFGFNWPGHNVAAAYRLLGHIPIKAGSRGGLIAATEVAIDDLAASEDVHLSSAAGAAATAAKPKRANTTSTSAAHSNASSIGMIAIATAIVALLAALVLAIRIRLLAASGQEERDQPPARGPAAGEGSALRVPWVLRGAVALCICAGIPLVLLAGPKRSAGASSDSSDSASAELAFTWPEGRQPAPNFELTDQEGRTVSPSAYRGRPVIITFIDPLCRNLCPLAAKVLSEADERIPAAQRPQIIAVSVDVYADTRADLLEDFHRWSLTPGWQWAIGQPRQLASVWKRYYVEVSVQTKAIAGVTAHYITHSELAYVIDGNGYERALLTWPYTARQVEKTVQRLSPS